LKDLSLSDSFALYIIHTCNAEIGCRDLTDFIVTTMRIHQASSSPQKTTEEREASCTYQGIKATAAKRALEEAGCGHLLVTRALSCCQGKQTEGGSG